MLLCVLNVSKIFIIDLSNGTVDRSMKAADYYNIHLLHH